MDKIQFDRLIKPLVEIYDEIELEIIKKILERVNNYDSVSGSLKWYLEKLADLGTLNKEILNILKTNKKYIETAIKDLSKNTVASIDDFDRLYEYYNDGLIEINPSDLFNSTSINNLIKNATKDVRDITDLIDSKVLEGTNEAYKKILNKAYIETASGIYTYRESIRRALEEFSKEGIRTVHYSNGRTLSIEAVVRRDVITRMNKLIGDVELENAKKLKTNLVYVDQHEGARTRTPYIKHDYEAHDEWQGKVYMIEGSSEKYDNLYEKTGFGEMLGLKGLNCHHDFRPYFEWETIPKRIDEEKNREKRELLDKQRNYESKIRQLKHEEEIYKQIDKEEYKKVCNKLKITNNQYNEFLEKNNLNRDYSREYITSKLNGGLGVNGFITKEDIYKTKVLNLGKIDINMKDNAIDYYEKVISQQKVENAIIIQKNGEVVRCIGSKYGVGIYGNLKNAIITHNHVTIDEEIGGSFGKDDWEFLINNHKNNITLRAIDEKYIYKIRTLKNITLNDYQNSYINARLIDDDFKHCVMIDLTKKGLIKYERTIRK